MRAQSVNAVISTGIHGTYVCIRYYRKDTIFNHTFCSWENEEEVEGCNLIWSLQKSLGSRSPKISKNHEWEGRKITFWRGSAFGSPEICKREEVFAKIEDRDIVEVGYFSRLIISSHPPYIYIIYKKREKKRNLNKTSSNKAFGGTNML